jgi:hypothetical protein
MWSFLSDFIVRSTGFPQHLMDRLTFPQSMIKIKQYVQLEQSHESERDWFLLHFNEWVASMQLTYPKGDPIFKLIYKMKKQVSKGNDIRIEKWPVNLPPGKKWIEEYNKRRAMLMEQRAEMKTVLQNEWKEKTASLHTILKEPKIQEAIAHSNPEVWKTLQGYLQKSMSDMKPWRKRYEERTYSSYLQRFLFKNDTTSFFGPLNYGQFYKQTEPVKYIRTGSIPSKRRSFLAYWAVEALANEINREEEWKPYLPLSLQDSFYLTNDGVIQAQTRKKLTLIADVIYILRQSDGRTINENLNQAYSKPVIDQLEKLIEKGIVQRGYRVCPSHHHLLEELMHFVESLPNAELRKEWLTRLNQFQLWQAEYSNGDAEQKVRILQQAGNLFRSITGKEPTQAQGMLYADRHLFCEECAGDIKHFTLSTNLKKDIESRISPILDWGYSIAVRKKNLAQQKAHEIFIQLIERNGLDRVPLLTFLLALKEHAFEIDLGEKSPSKLLANWVSMQTLQKSKKIELQDEWIQEQIRSSSFHKHLCVTSPDLMLQAENLEKIEQGDFQWVIGEVHWGTQGMSNLLYFHPNRNQWIKEVTQSMKSLPNGKHLVNVVLKQRAGKNFFVEMFEKSITLMGASAKEQKHVYPFAELYVTKEDGELVIKNQKEERIIPHMGEPNNPIALIFSEPSVVIPKFHIENHTPRIEYRNVVIQRETWIIPTSEWSDVSNKDQYEQILHTWKLKQKFGLPDEVFVRVDSEMKPFYVHFHNLFLIDLLLKYVRSEEKITFSELLPNRNSTWFRNHQGSYCCELRGIMIRPEVNHLSGKEDQAYANIET